MYLVKILAVLGGLCLSLAGAAEVRTQSLFNGVDLSGWDTWLGAPEVPAMPLKLWGDWPPQIGLNSDEAQVYSVVQIDGAPAIRISGEYWGALISRARYADYHLQLQYRWGERRYTPRADKPRNSGLLYHSTGQYGVFWSYWMRSIEFEIMENCTGDFTAVDDVSGKIRAHRDFDAPYPWLRYGADGDVRGVGGMVFRVSALPGKEHTGAAWNTIDLYVVGDGAVHQLNGQTVLRIEQLRHKVDGKQVPLVSGRIQLQSEGAEIYFRNLTLRGIDALPAD